MQDNAIVLGIAFKLLAYAIFALIISLISSFITAQSLSKPYQNDKQKLTT